MNVLNIFRGPARAVAPQLSASEAVKLCAKGDLTVLDVRGGDEIAASGRAAGALHIPLALINSHADPRNSECHPELRTTKAVAVYCASGARSQMAMQMLVQMGYETVHNIGSLGDWVSAGGATTR
jgi:rhodanese-related sulfurtransferase